jgi:hypothetical protein
MLHNHPRCVLRLQGGYVQFQPLDPLPVIKAVNLSSALHSLQQVLVWQHPFPRCHQGLSFLRPYALDVVISGAR